MALRDANVEVQGRRRSIVGGRARAGGYGYPPDSHHVYRDDNGSLDFEEDPSMSFDDVLEAPADVGPRPRSGDDDAYEDFHDEDYLSCAVSRCQGSTPG